MASSINEPLISRLYTSRNNLLSILEKQGYNVQDYTNLSVHEVHSMKESKQLDMLMTNTNNNTKVYVKYHLGKSLRPKHVYEYIEDLYQLESILTPNDQLIIIIKEKVNDTLTELIRQLFNTEKYYINIFQLDTLLYNILNHDLVPPHRILNDKEVKELIKKYNIIDMKQFPEISRFDPVAKLIGIRPGQMCEIIRSSKTAITSNYYRFCY